MKFWRHIIVALVALLLFLAIVPLRSREYGGFKTSSFVGFVAFFLVTFICLKVFSKNTPWWWIVSAVLIGRWVLEIPMRTLYFEGTLISLPDSLMHTVGILAGFLFWRLKGVSLKIIPLVLGCLLSAWLSFYGYDLWAHKLAHGTFTGVVNPSDVPANFKAVDEKAQLVTNGDLAGKIVLLDFWYTRCGVCFLKFPKLQAAYEKYRDDPGISIYALNKPIEEDAPGEAFNVIRQEGYSFPVIIATDKDLPATFGVTRYPTTIVINPDNQVVFRGDIEGAVKAVEELKQKD
jgi:thiol-disulfide isomerase/thioredoxin